MYNSKILPGRLVSDTGIYYNNREIREAPMFCIDDAYIRSTIYKRKEDSHKGDFGRLLIFAGSPGMAGAAIMCGRAALKAGAGLVQFLLPDFESPLLTILQCAVPEATCLQADSVKSLSGYSAVVAGSGIGKSKTSLTLLTRIIETFQGPLILDADALNLISENQDLAERIRSYPGERILTPHIGEARRLLSISQAIKSPESRKAAACALAERYRSIAVLKGAGTLVAWQDPERADAGYQVYQNTTGNPGMATAGSGDALAGLIGGLAAQGYAPADAARMGVFLHGKAGDLAAGQLSEMGVTTSDIIHFIPFALKEFYPA